MGSARCGMGGAEVGRALTFHRLWATRRPAGRSQCRPGRFQVEHSWSLQLFLRSARLAELTEAGQNRRRKDKSRCWRIDGAWRNHRLLVSGELSLVQLAALLALSPQQGFILFFLFLIFIILFFFAFTSRAEIACGLVLQQPQGGLWINQRWRG